MNHKNEKILLIAKPTIWYYLFSLIMPFIFFLTDDWRDLFFVKWEKSMFTYAQNIGGLFVFFGISILMILLRRVVTVYMDRIVVSKPAIRLSKTYYFSDLISWNLMDYTSSFAIHEVKLILRFRKKKMRFNRIELTEFGTIVTFLEENFLNLKV